MVEVSPLDGLISLTLLRPSTLRTATTHPHLIRRVYEMKRMMSSSPLLLLSLLVILTAPLGVVVPFIPSLPLTEAWTPRQNVPRSITSRTNRATLASHQKDDEQPA